jgi:hypothetical protein
MITRRLFGLGLLAAPAIVRTPGLLMPVRASRVVVFELTIVFRPEWWLQTHLEDAFLQVLAGRGPVRYTPVGLKLLQDAARAATQL